jgi:hypothetical protein
MTTRLAAGNRAVQGTIGGMAEPTARRPWWRRRWWWVAGGLWLALPAAYVGSFVAAAYSEGRGWITHDAIERAYMPLLHVSVRWRWRRALEDIYYDTRDAGVRDRSAY